jgi:hypothetical protein
MADLRADLYALAALHADTHLPADLFREISSQAALLSLTEAFRDRLRADPLDMGTAQRGQLRRLMNLCVEAFERTESVSETRVQARCACRSVRVMWNFSATDKSTVASFDVSVAYGPARPVPLLHMSASRDGQGARPLLSRTAVQVNVEGLDGLDAILGCRIGAVELLHVLVGYFPEFIDEEWELHELLCDSLATSDEDIDDDEREWLGRPWWRRQWWHR